MEDQRRKTREVTFWKNQVAEKFTTYLQLGDVYLFYFIINIVGLKRQGKKESVGKKGFCT
jgi:hypothetical protein